MSRQLLILLIVCGGAAACLSQSTFVDEFQAIAEVSGSSGSTIVVMAPHTDIIEGGGGATALGFLYFIQFDSISTGLFMPEIGYDISIFPNPASGQITIQVDDSISGPVEVYLFNISGQMVLNRSLVFGSIQSRNTTTLGVGHLTSGTFALILLDHKNQLLHREIVTIQSN